MAAKAARPARPMELPMVLAEPLNGVIGELDGCEAGTTPVEATPVPVGAGAPPAGLETAGACPGGGGTADPWAGELGVLPLSDGGEAGELGVLPLSAGGEAGLAGDAGEDPTGAAGTDSGEDGEEPTGAGGAGVLPPAGATVTVWYTVTGAGQLGQVGQEATGAGGWAGLCSQD